MADISYTTVAYRRHEYPAEAARRRRLQLRRAKSLLIIVIGENRALRHEIASSPSPENGITIEIIH